MSKIIPTDIPIVPHPFFPLGVELVDYVANDQNVPTLLAGFAAGCASIIVVAQALVRRFNPRLSTSDKVLVTWFIFTGCIHFFFEGYFSFNHARMPAMQDFFGQLWKEYALSDSRYLTLDPFVLCMESITAILWGPLSMTTAWLITSDSPYRHPLQALVSTGQIYGDILYYATSMFDLYIKGVSYSRPEAYYFWVYFMLMNAFWIAIPGYCLYTSATATARAMTGMKKIEKTVALNGKAKKAL